MGRTKPMRMPIPYSVAQRFRPNGGCYCDLDDEDCYNAGHWTMMKKLKVEIETINENGMTAEVLTMYDIPADGLSRAVRVASVIERLMDRYPSYSAINVSITKDADDGTQIHEPPRGKPGT